MRAALADMAPDKMALVRSDMRQIFPPPESPTFRRSTRVKSAMLSHFFSPKSISRRRGAHFAHSRAWTPPHAPVDPWTRRRDPSNLYDRPRWCVIPRPNPARLSPTATACAAPRVPERFSLTTRVSNPRNTAFRPRIDLVVAPPLLRLRARRASKGRSPTTTRPPPVALSSSCSSSTTTAAASTFSTRARAR